ncbi:MAG TPA: 4-alpha-glucanotransferase [Candidatus Onthovivens sp.]|nr:4-alpha-glucanotransferase [Candidatus Onthovivens sp.]
MKNKEAGILLHISSLPSKYGIGTLGEEAYKFVDFLKASKMKIWQILPLNLTSYGDSPYQSPSNYALNYYFIDLDILHKKGLLDKKDYVNEDFGDDETKIDYGTLYLTRVKVLKKAFERFNRKDKDFQEFLTKNKNFEDFAVFMVIKEINENKPWMHFKKGYRIYCQEVFDKVKSVYEDLFLFYMWTQFEFLNQYFKLKEYANENNVKIMGDLPLYVAIDSVEAWKYPELFAFNEHNEPINVAGCPPDAFSVDGQLWGNPVYNWEYHKKTNYKWWNERIDNALNLYDYLRIDHFRGFSAYYSIPFKDTTARNGKWVKGPGFDLFVDKKELPIVAEDLGLLDDDFYQLMDQCGYPGMKIVTQGLDNLDEDNIWKPSNYTYNFFAYTSTHDSQTSKQFIEELDKKSKDMLIKAIEKECKKFSLPFNKDASEESLVYTLCELNLASASKAALLPLQDIFAIGKRGRMNFPSTVSVDNWSWRISKDEFDNNYDIKVSFLKGLVEKYQRD